MEVRNCKNCGRLFNYIGGAYRNLCPVCIDALEDKFQEVRKYVEDNPRCTMNEISEAMDVSTKQIEKWIREERLCFADDSPIGIGCEKCGKMIKSGKFCDTCRVEMGSQMNNLYKAVNPGPYRTKDSASKMRYLDK